MPINPKGQKILSNMKKTYGEKEGKSVFYASINKGKISGVEGKRPKHKPSKHSYTKKMK